MTNTINDSNNRDDSSCSHDLTGSRPIRVTVGTGRYDSSEMFASEITEEWKARFHGWCKCYHCPAGDGSMMQEITMALVEMSNGEMKYIEPTKIHFENVRAHSQEGRERDPDSNTD